MSDPAPQTNVPTAASPPRPRPAPRSLAIGKLPDAIPCSLVRFERATDVPGESSATRVKCEMTPGNQRRWTATLIPALRSFEITYYPPAGGEPIVGYVHETMSNGWTPA